MKPLWEEIFAKFILDIAKVVFTTFILGGIITPQLVNSCMLAGSVIF